MTGRAVELKRANGAGGVAGYFLENTFTATAMIVGAVTAATLSPVSGSCISKDIGWNQVVIIKCAESSPDDCKKKRRSLS